jgi:hypothetical protein
MKIRNLVSCAALALALAATGCNRSATLTLTPDPIVVGLLDTKVNIHAHAVAKGYGSMPFDHVQFAVYNANNELLVSTKEKIDTSGGTSVMDRDYTVPINGAAIALSHTKYIEVRILDPNGNEIAARRLDIVVHALNGLSLPAILMPKDTTSPSPAQSPSPSPPPAATPASIPEL